MTNKKFDKNKFPFSWYSGWGGYQMRVDPTSSATKIGEILGKYLSTSRLNEIFSRIEYWAKEITHLLRIPNYSHIAAEEIKKYVKKRFRRGKEE